MTTETDLYVCEKAGEFFYCKGCPSEKPHVEVIACRNTTSISARLHHCPDTYCIPVPKEPEAGQEG